MIGNKGEYFTENAICRAIISALAYSLHSALQAQSPQNFPSCSNFILCSKLEERSETLYIFRPICSCYFGHAAHRLQHSKNRSNRRY